MLFVVTFSMMMNTLYALEKNNWEQHFQECIDGNCEDGKGTMSYYSNQKYEGELKNGKRHGKGKIIYPDGRVCTGEFKWGERTGYGTMTYPDGREKTGIFF